MSPKINQIGMPTLYPGQDRWLGRKGHEVRSNTGFRIQHPLRRLVDIGKWQVKEHDPAEVLMGTPASPFQTGAIIELDPCDSSGEDNGEGNQFVYCDINQDSVDISTADPNGGASQSTGSYFNPGSNVLQYALAQDGKYYLLGAFTWVIKRWKINTTDNKVQCQIVFQLGLSWSSVSGWLNLHDTDVCP